jgi:S-(hydroxymethyl)glutathione dehydrogenase/alcohol dehydrogenase
MVKIFKAAVLFKQNQPLKIIDLELPKELEKGQVVVKVISAAICGAQIGEIKGIKGKDKWLPHCMGHEGYGLVVEKNKFVKKVNIGDYVIMHWRKGSGLDSKPANYNSNYGKINAGQVTTFQEYSVVSENRVTKVKKFNPKNSIIAPLLGCAVPTSWGILHKELKIKNENKILIFGGGGVGVTLGVLSKIFKCKDITIVDKSNYKKNILNYFKIKFINIREVSRIKNMKFDKVIDTTGIPHIMSVAFDHVDKNGTLIFVGQPRKNSTLKIKDPLKLFNPPSDNIRIITSDGGSFNPSKDMRFINEILKSNILKFKKIVSHTVKLRDINKGLKILKLGKGIRVGITL